MITIYKSILSFENKPENYISRLIWKTKLVESLIFSKTTTFESNTIRPLIGELNEKEGTLSLTRVRPLRHHFFPKIIVDIENNRIEENNSLTLKFKLGIMTTLFTIFPIWVLVKITLELINEFNLELLTSFTMWFIFVVGGFIFLTLFEIRKIKKIIFEIITTGID
jgi:hypothetical protein